MCKLIAYLSVIPAIKSAITLSSSSFLKSSLFIYFLEDLISPEQKESLHGDESYRAERQEASKELETWIKDKGLAEKEAKEVKEYVEKLREKVNKEN